MHALHPMLKLIEALSCHSKLGFYDLVVQEQRSRVFYNDDILLCSIHYSISLQHSMQRSLKFLKLYHYTTIMYNIHNDFKFQLPQPISGIISELNVLVVFQLRRIS